MNGEQIIPPIKDPLGRYWEQPERGDIEVDDTHALMSEKTFNQLPEYSLTLPSGTYEGKMWRANRGNKWYMAWYCPDPYNDPNAIGIQWREVLIS